MIIRIVVVDAEELKELIHGTVKSAIAGHGQPSEWLDARSAPMGPRAFQRLARQRAFPAVKLGKKWQARRSDVEAYMEQHRPPRREEAPSADDIDPVRAAIEAGRLWVVGAGSRPG